MTKPREVNHEGLSGGMERLRLRPAFLMCNLKESSGNAELLNSDQIGVDVIQVLGI